MSEEEAEHQYAKIAVTTRLPPMFGPIENGQRTWIRVEDIDYDLMGYLLSCHLIIEHYMDVFLKTHYGDLDWDAAKPTFGQRVNLLTTWSLGPPFNPVQAIKHLNTLRNRLGHRVDYHLTDEDMLPFIHYLGAVSKHGERELDLNDKSPKRVLELFTSLAAACFAGAVTSVGAAGR
ncbi:hypothetical protein ISN76_11240 [Dyella halodurans]|uniref:pEK499-p136 HEPN domain-containing protein n=1 Tax=Dyella halodurans TaxID=1920171 RepID=A0ABV9C2W7_9GAMM|nr:hypothetical protein [Dyella halodurans]